MITMKEKIIEILAQHPNGFRTREIEMYLQCGHFSLFNLLNKMKDENLITRTGVNNFAQGESYILWKLVK